MEQSQTNITNTARYRAARTFAVFYVIVAGVFLVPSFAYYLSTPNFQFMYAVASAMMFALPYTLALTALFFVLESAIRATRLTVSQLEISVTVALFIVLIAFILLYYFIPPPFHLLPPPTN